MPSVTNICNELYFVAWLVSSENHGNEGSVLCFFLGFGGVISLCHILWGGKHMWVLNKAQARSQAGCEAVCDCKGYIQATRDKELSCWLLIRRQ